jgi:hypothetical protein
MGDRAMTRIVLAVALIALIVSAAPLRAEGPFDGEWKGKFIAQTPKVCLFGEKDFDATVKDNEFVAVIDQEGVERNFEGTIGKEGKLDIWGKWKMYGKTAHAEMGVSSLNISVNFSGSKFEGRSLADISQMTMNRNRCEGVIYMARAPLTLDEFLQQVRMRMEAFGEGTWVKMRPVAELKKLIEAAEGAEKRSRGQAQDVRRPAPTRLQAKGR